ncbi:glycoside hydrolase family 65 protein [uncultured Chloroflexus sp.]|uniref:glycoside hydrolase family 65 protein n=1 Tax=uncultured Chloroflexus sp. TaxID=214040 RepID=UPI00263982BD|nr:glycoside hydrolase family 65 protein [uncultured Chloroflexus sp.]
MWILSEDTFDPAKQHHKETIFTIGNGYLSTRGAFEEGYPNDRRATFIHGVFDDAPIVVTELANAPDWLALHVLLDGEKFSLATGTILAYRRELDLQSGVLRREVRWQSPQGRVARLIFTRFASLADEHLLALRCEIIPEFDGQVELRAAINGQTDNEGLLHWQPLTQGQLTDGTVFLRTRTRKSRIELALAMRLLGNAAQTAFWDVENVPTVQQVYVARAGQPIVVTKFVGIATSRDTAAPLELAHRHLQATPDWESALAAQRQVWAREWERCQIVIEGDDEADLAVRFSIFQLLIAAPRRDNRVNIGAKTLSGFGYRGHAFWDTEIFMLPLFTYTAPEIARNLLDYRYFTLPAARAKARAAGYEGAWYAWESADTGEEVTPTWVPDFHDKKKLARVWTGDLAIHISADVAYAVQQFWQATGDDPWYIERGAEIVLDTAKFFASRAEWLAERGCYGYTDVIGPDEYHDHVNNNAYTNLLAQWNLRAGLETLAWLDQHAPQKAAELRRQLDLTPDRLQHWQTVAEKICVNVGANGLIEQFDGFFQLKDVNLADYEPRTKSMHEIFGIEEANEYQAIKQPDVLMLQFLLREQYSDSQIRVNYDYYTPRTDHTYGSSLGPPIQAIVACQMGDIAEAYEHFIRAARADLRDVRGNAGDGIHAASAGGVWQAVVFGFGGLRIHPDGTWAVYPRLPSHWRRLTYRFTLRGTTHTITCYPNGHYTMG